MPIAAPCHTRTAETTDSWITPKWLIDRLGPFELDPCASDPQPWPCAARQFTENGLILPWDGFWWCNPPYGRSLGEWLHKCAVSRGVGGIALVFARTETRAFQTVWKHASLLLFIKGRLSFFKPDGTESKIGHNSGGPSVLIAYGDVARERLLENSDLGACVEIVR